MVDEGGIVQLVPLDRPPRVVGAGVAVHGRLRSHDRFRLPDLWSLHLYRYRAELTLDGVRYVTEPGSASLVAPGVDIRYAYEGPSEHVYAHLALEPVGALRPVPAVQPVGVQTPLLSDLMLGVVTSRPADAVLASAQAWAVLHRLAALGRRPASSRHPSVDAAIVEIESRLAHPLTVAGLARSVGLSHNHLTRLFRAATGQSVVGYIRRRRLLQAEHLLRSSTLPVSAIARSVGYPDLQAFNKACHRELGASPREVRAAGVRPV